MMQLNVNAENEKVFFIDGSTDPQDIAKLTKTVKVFLKIVSPTIIALFCIDVLPSLFNFIINGNRLLPLDMRYA